jgi:thioester reductase-like protein
MADKGVFFTGAGGFLGRFLLSHYLERDDCDLFLLENGPFCKKLEAFVDSRVLDQSKRARIRIVEGDITKSDLGIDAPTRKDLSERVTDAIHLAALYNLSAPRDISVRININGTRNVLDFLETAKNLRRLAHTSTLAVAGTYSGVFSEDDFDKGQSFKNFYEETKFLSEKLVRERLSTIPSVIFRPAVVVGHSKTGLIEKLDGPYYMFVAIKRRLHAIAPNCGRTLCHVAPVDFVTDGFYSLFEDDMVPNGSVFFLMDPAPMRYNDVFDLACERWPEKRMKPIIRAPLSIMRPIARLSAFTKITGIPWEAFMYGGQVIEYDVRRSAEALARHGVRCPSLPSYMDVLLKYFIEHYNDGDIRRDHWWELKK